MFHIVTTQDQGFNMVSVPRLPSRQTSLQQRRIDVYTLFRRHVPPGLALWIDWLQSLKQFFITCNII